MSSARRGQGTIEWVAVLGACALLSVGALRVVDSDALGGSAIQAALADVAHPAEAIQPAGAPPGLLGLPLPPGDGASVVAVAEQLLKRSVAEEPLGSNAGPAVLTLTDGNAEAWCADFVSWVLRAAGRAFTGGASGGWRIAWTPDVRSWFAARGRYRARVVALPQPGDVVWFRHGHVGIVLQVSSTRLETIEGNAGDRVARRTYERWQADVDIDGFGRPAPA